MLTPLIDKYDQFSGFEHTCPSISESVAIKTTLSHSGGFDWLLIDHDRNNLELPKSIEVCPFCSVNLKDSSSSFNPLEWLKTAAYPQGFTGKNIDSFERSLLGAYAVSKEPTPERLR